MQALNCNYSGTVYIIQKSHQITMGISSMAYVGMALAPTLQMPVKMSVLKPSVSHSVITECLHEEQEH